MKESIMATHTTGYSRRSVLSISGTALAGLGAGCLGGSEKQPTMFRLEAKASGWQGREPSEIAGQSNPTLNLEQGTTYEIVWENLDGQKHELQIRSNNGTTVESSTHSEMPGHTRKLSIAATGNLSVYRCEYHPNSMQGTVSVSD